MSTVFKTIAIVVLMAISATGFAQTNDVNNESNDSNPAGTSLTIKAVFPVPLGIDYFVTEAYATITWHGPSGSQTLPTSPLEKVDDRTFEGGSWTPVNDVTHVTYEVWGWYYNGTKGYSATGTFDVTLGVTNTLIITSWPFFLIKDMPDDTD